MQLNLVKKDFFGEVGIDLHQNDRGEVFMTIEQLANALEYKGKSSIDSIVSRNPYLRESEFSVTCKMQATDGKGYNTRLFTEDGIYEVTMLSRQPKAREFRHYIRKLLKGLRKGELQIKQTPTTYIEALRALADAEEQKELLSQEVVGLNKAIDTMQPKVEYLDTILDSTDTLNITQIAKDYGLSGQELNKVLHDRRVQYKVGNQWVLYHDHIRKGYTNTHTHVYNKPNGETGTNLQTKWTQKGRLFIHDVLTDMGIVALMDKEEEK